MSDERLGTHYAKLLFEKGFDNVYLLSGGLEKFLAIYPTLVEGTKVPEIKKVSSNKGNKENKKVIGGSSKNTT